MNKHIKGYFYSPLAIWAIANIIYDILNLNIPFFEDILRSIWVNQVYHIIFWPSLFLVVFLEILPMRKALREGIKQKETRILCLTILIGLILLFWTEAPIFFAEVIAIMQHQQPEIIIDKQLYEETKAQLYVYQLVFPFIAKLIIELSFKRSLRKYGLQTEENIRQYAPRVFPILFMTLVLSAIWVVTVNEILV